MKKPLGALSREEATQASIVYIVYTTYRYIGLLNKVKYEDLIPIYWWPDADEDNSLGYVFKNYFHALAFHLKCKHKERTKQ